MYKRFLKPAFDYLAATISLLLAWPFILIVYLVNRIVFGTGFFIQQRIGLRNQPFNCFKFRSMKTKDDDSTIPAWGKFLRYTSIDELPQLLNILRGEMSLVGPRPLLPQYLNSYSEEQIKRHNVKPGITGLAQVNGRNKLSWQESLAFDTEYAAHVTFGLDFKIILLTIPQVFKFGQVHQNEHVTRESFDKQGQK